MVFSTRSSRPDRASTTTRRRRRRVYRVGIPTSQLFTVGSAYQKQLDALAKQNTNLDLNDYAPFVNNPVQPTIEPPNAQAIYAVMDGPMGAVLTQPNANIPQLLKDANAKVQQILSSGS